MGATELALGWEPRLAQAPTAMVPVNSLRLADSPRLGGENIDHVRVLAGSPDPLPPILVHLPTMQIIDGMHRLRAAIMRGQDEIEARLLDCDEHELFVIAVKANIAHGLPLSLAERKRAAVRVIASHPQWSDRLVASVAGLSHKTVATIRRSATGSNSQLHVRRGHDGRVRPLSSARGRRIAGDLLRDNPSASLREVAEAAGISPGTVRDVRARLERGQDAVPPERSRGAGKVPVSAVGTRQQRESVRQARETCSPEDSRSIRARRGSGEPADDGSINANMPGRPENADAVVILWRLKKDPALRSSERGRDILRQLHVYTMGIKDFGEVLTSVPTHSAIIIGKLARANAKQWKDLASQLEERAQLSLE
jgi:AraC-like DNA-binding protein